MTGHTRLYRRGATYYHRAVVPKDIIDSYGKSEETFSLRTKDRAEALVRVKIEAVRVDRLFTKHREALASKKARTLAPILSELTVEQVARAKAAYIHHLLDEDEEARLDGFFDPEEHSEPLAEQPRETFEEHQDSVEDSDSIARANLARGKRDEFFRSEAEDVLDWDGIDLSLAEGSPSWARLIRALQEATVEAMATKRRRDKGDSAPTPSYPSSAPQASDQPTFSSVVNTWEEENARGAWSPKVRNDYLAWTTLFVEIVGDRPLDRYSKEDARAFKAVLMKLPANWRKKRLLKDLPVKDAVAKAETLGLEPMSTTTLNKAIGRLASFWNWSEAHYDGIKPSLFKGLSMRQPVAARDQRDPFSPEQLDKLFSSPVFVGCESERRCAEPGTHSMRGTARFWLPLLGLFTGARLNELCQLTPSNVCEENGITYLEITNEAEGQRLKTASGKRRIPIHRRLVELGFLEFASERQEAKTNQLFPELKMDASGYLSGEFSKFFSRYLERIDAKTSKTSFHSFRHNFEDACRNGGVAPQIMNALQGHSEQGMAGRYGDGQYNLTLLNAAIDLIDYAGTTFGPVR